MITKCVKRDRLKTGAFVMTWMSVKLDDNSNGAVHVTILDTHKHCTKNAVGPSKVGPSRQGDAHPH
jgi:hypothetical protein